MDISILVYIYIQRESESEINILEYWLRNLNKNIFIEKKIILLIIFFMLLYNSYNKYFFNSLINILKIPVNNTHVYMWMH